VQFILVQKYSYYEIENQLWKGTDSLFIEKLNEGKPKKITFIPILIYMYYKNYYDKNYGDSQQIINILKFTRQDLDDIKNKFERQKNENSDLPIIWYEYSGKIISKDQDPYIEYTGNECQPHFEENLYLSCLCLIESI
jgi:hypothetical protein